MMFPPLHTTLAILLVGVGCSNQDGAINVHGINQDSHTWFPIASGVHAIGASTSQGPLTCSPCHTASASSFKQFSCLDCHEHEQSLTDQMHTGVKDYGYTSPQCLSCHPSGAKAAFDHAGITSNCAPCHAEGARFPALPVAGFTHQPMNGADCSACHNTTGWKSAAGAPMAKSHDPKADVVVNALIPTYAGTSISSMTARTEQLPMSMAHGSGEIARAAMSACTNCHPNTSGGSYYPGYLHASLATLAKDDPTVTQPMKCASCHADASPVGFVGPNATNPVRKPPSGEMKHDAVAWSNGKATTTSMVPSDCGLCHQVPSGNERGSWSAAPAGGTPTYHAALSAAGAPQPTSCIDCHANSDPEGLTDSTTPTSATTGAATDIAAGTVAQINHADVNVSGRDCNFCHTENGPSTKAGVQGKEWTQATFHAHFTSAASPLVMNKTTGRCSTCHMAEKPGTAYTKQDHSTFTSTSGSEDCSACHTFPGTGTLAAPNWLGAANVPQIIVVGGFPVSQPPATTSTTQSGIPNLPHPTVGTGASCTTCHATASGGKQAIGYDHKSTLINTSCNACHEAGSNLVGTVWNRATSQGAGAGDTRPYSIVGLVVSTDGNTRPLNNGFNHFYPVDCAECHLVPAGNGLVTTGVAYTSAWRFDHNERRMKKSSTCNMCHGSPNNLPGD